MQIPSPLQEIQVSIAQEKGLRLFVKRDDLIHPLISGNKYRKLKYNLAEAKAKGCQKLLTFGGAYSNHVHAFAAACQAHDFKGICIIRGEKVEPLNATLSFAVENGVELQFVSRSEYRQRNDATYLAQLQQKYPSCFFIPEGGTNEYALQGVAELVQEVKAQSELHFDYWFTALGTGGTLGGILSAIPDTSKAIGISALKGLFVINDFEKWTQGKSNWEILTHFHHGGYAKHSEALIDFIRSFKEEQNITLEPVYTGKVFYAIFDLIKNDFFKKGANILLVHTGGLQGLKGFEERYGISF